MIRRCRATYFRRGVGASTLTLRRERLLERERGFDLLGGEIEAVGEFVAAAAPLAEFRQHARFDPTAGYDRTVAVLDAGIHVDELSILGKSPQGSLRS